LWRTLAGRHLVVADLTPIMLGQMPVLTEQYGNVPMDLADG
jgi:hypothetical protein